MSPGKSKRTNLLYRWGVPLAIVLGCVSYVMKFYHRYFIYQGDTFLHVGAWMNTSLIAGGWDPYNWNYMGWFPMFNLHFPTYWILYGAVEGLGIGESWSKVTYLLQAHALFWLMVLCWSFYWFFRKLGLRRPSSFLACFLVALSGPHFHLSVRELDVFYTISYAAVPFVFWCISEAVHRRSIARAVAGGFLVGLTLLSGANVPLFQFVPLFPLAFLLRTSEGMGKKFPWRKLWQGCKYSAVSMGAGLVVGAAMILPSMAYMRFTLRSEHVKGQIFSPEVGPSALYFFFTSALRNWWIEYESPPLQFQKLPFHELDVYLGLPVLFLVFLGLKKSKTGQAIRWFMLFLLAYAFACMHLRYVPGPLQPLIDFPMQLLSMRYPYRFFMALLVGVAFFAAKGLENLTESYTEKSRKVVLAFALCALAIHLFSRRFLYTPVPSETEIVAMETTWWVNLGFFVTLLLVLFGTVNRAKEFSRLMLLPVGFILLALWTVRSDFPVSPSLYPESMKAAEEVLFSRVKRFGPVLAAHGKPTRVLNPSRGLLLGTAGRFNGYARVLNTEIAFDLLGDPSTALYLDRIRKFLIDEDSPILSLYNVGFIRTSIYQGTRLKPAAPDLIFRNPDVFDRHFWTNRARVFSNEDELFESMARVKSPGEYAEAVFLQRDGDGGTHEVNPGREGSKAEIQLLRQDPDLISMHIKADGDGYLVSSDLWFPAWRAYVDGKAVPILRAYGAFRALPLAAGNHLVEYRFEDGWRTLGRWISAAGVLCCLLFLVLAARKKSSGFRVG